MLFRSKPGLSVACGAIGIGEITSIPTAPAITDAYYRYDGRRRFSLPIQQTPYERREKDTGALRQVSNDSCIGCGLCMRTCTAEAIRVVERRAMLDTDCCLSCGMCAVRCPKGAIDLS